MPVGVEGYPLPLDILPEPGLLWADILLREAEMDEKDQ